MSDANERQVGGQHYRASNGIQHWDFVVAARLGYFEGQITKYVARWRKKNGPMDLEKADHFLQKLLEVSEGETLIRNPALLDHPLQGSVFYGKFAEDNQLTPTETEIIWRVATWRTRADLGPIRTLLLKMIDAPERYHPEV